MTEKIRSTALLPVSALAAALCLGFAGCAEPSPDSGVWTNTATVSAGEQFPKLHGFFNAEPVSVTLRDLPDHRWVKVKFKVLVTGTWDGSFLPWGPDLWTFQVRGGQQMMMTSFSSMGAKSANYVQAYPDDYPWGLHYAYTGGFPVDGKPFAEPDSTGMAVSRAWYPVEVSIPHTGREVTLDFAGVYDDPPEEKQRWGIADFEYSTAKAAVEIDDVELYRLWDELASRESVRGNAAMWKLISAGDKAAKFVAAKADSFGSADASLYNRPEGLRMRRVQKILRILRTPGTTGSGSELTYRLPEMNMRTPRVSE